MPIVCPRCGSSIFAPPGAGELSCQSCGHRWEAKAPAAWELFLQRDHGDVVAGPFDRNLLREQLYTRQLSGEERVRAPLAANFERLGDLPEFASILELVGGVAPRTGARIGGWQAAPASNAESSEPPAAPTPAPPTRAPAPVAPPAPPPKPKTTGVSLLVVGLALLGLLALVLLFLISQM